MTDEPQGQEIEVLLKDAQAQIEQGTLVSFEDLVRKVAPPPAPAPARTLLPRPVRITKAQQEALDRLPDVYGKVVPDERRVLTADEATQLLEERAVITEIGGLCDKRKEDIRLTVLNHNDVAAEEDDTSDLLADKDGHHVRKGVVLGQRDAATKFAVSVTKGSQTLDPARLKALADDDSIDWFTHDDYLAMTRQERVFDENRAMLAIQHNPQLVRAIREATVTGTPSLTVNQRKV